MANVGVALTKFGNLIGLLDDSGSVDWLWLTDPLGNTSKQMSARRDDMAKLFAALQEPDGTNIDTVDPNDFNDQHWRPLSIGPMQVGVVWNKVPTDPLHLGLGAMYPRTDGAKGLSASLLMRLLQVAPSLSPELGRILLSADLTLDNATLHEIKLDAGFDPSLAIALELTNATDEKKKLALPPTTTLPWDATRLAAFLTKSWIAAKSLADQQANVKDSFFLRMDKHFFPMLGDSATAIKPMTPVDATGQPAEFKAWTDSVLTTSSADGALLLLWHLRALITGNESGTLFGGSTYLPLLAPAGPAEIKGQTPSFVSSATTYTQTVAAGGTGVWLGIREIAGGTEVALDFRPGGGGAVETIALAQRVNGNLIRPTATVINSNNLKAAVLLPAPAGSGLKFFGPDPDGTVRIEVITRPGANVDIFDGAYTFSLLIKNGAPVRYRVDTPMLSTVLPPELPKPEVLAMQEAAWALKLLKGQLPAGNPMASLLDVFSTVLSGADPAAALQPANALSLVGSLLGAGPEGKLKIGDALALSLAGSNLTASLQLGPFKPGDLGGLNIALKELAASATFDLTKPSPLTSASLGLKGLQLPKANSDSGLVSTLLPDTKSLPGFALTVGFTGNTYTLEGGGNIKVQQKIGPVDVSGLSVQVTKQAPDPVYALTVGVDLSLSLGPIHVAAYDLGGTLPLSPPPNKGFGLSLRGLALSFDGGGIRLSGLFLNNNGDYVGGAVVSIMDRFQLSAIGGYTQVDGTASLFIFAALVAPLGGPPWFFITGIAGGFGFNRPLPPSSLLAEHPFMKVMRGELNFDPNQPGTALKNISGQFSPPQKGKYWIAAGIQFTCFAVINGKVIVAVSFGKEFSFQLLGMLSYGIQNICYFEIDFSVTADANHFLLQGALSPNSYLLDPSIFSLQGGFAMGVWYSGQYAGDFLISIGGYHPLFKRPDNYPDLARVGVKAVVSGFVHVDVQCFFACTPHLLMAGASISMYAKFAGISAGLDVYADVLIQWDPFFLLARLGVCVWFKFCGRHEVHVNLTIYTPKFGGKAEIDLWLVSFTVKFGDTHVPAPPLLEFPDMLTRHLNVPATASGVFGARLQAFSTPAAVGLFRIDVTDGRTSKASGSSEQEGLGAPIAVNPEFRFRVRTHLPLDETAQEPPLTLALDASGKGAIDVPGTMNAALCGWSEKGTSFRVEITEAGATPGQSPAINRLYDMFPMAVFGPPMKGAQVDQSAGEALAGIDPNKPSLPLLEGLEFVYKAVESPANLDVSKDGSAVAAEYSKPEETMPLPLNWQPNHLQVHAVATSALKFADATLKQTVKFVPPGMSSASRAADLMKGRTRAPWQVLVTVGTVQRVTVAVSPKALSVNSLAAARGLTTTAIPQSPARQPELMAVALRIAPTTTPAPVRRFRPPFVIRASDLSRQTLSLDRRDVQTALANVSRSLEMNINPGIAFDAARLTATAPVVPLVSAQGAPPLRPVPFPIPTLIPKPIPTLIPRPFPTLTPLPRPTVTPTPGPTPPPPRPTPTPTPTPPPVKPDLLLTPQTAGQIALQGGTPGAVHTFAKAGDALLRAVFFDGGDTLLDDRFVPAGTSEVAAPAGTRSAMFLHGGTLSPLTNNRRLGLYVAEACGVDSDTTVIAHSQRVFAAHGCVVQSSTPPALTAHALDTFSGAQLLRALTDYTVFFPAGAASLILVVEPIVDDPAAALDQVRWAANAASLTNLQTVVTPERTALLMDVQAASWSLSLSLGPDWRVSAVVVSPGSSSELATLLSTTNNWDLIDDRIQTGPQPASIAITYGGTK